jgi:AraC-like DNA-binding protein
MLAQGHTEAPAIGQAKRYIADHSEDELSLGIVARNVNMSASYFSEKFKEATGMNFVDYVARTRVEKARKLLQNPRLRISEVAFKVGFQSLSQFNRTLKKVTGESPRNYRAALGATEGQPRVPRSPVRTLCFRV